ncbi:MAG: molybdopterin-guanine dinucleotide biosynthesis protein B, partial [Marivita sp.]|uniref:molybdopterin-guanine dinucleotide biosynthesis protein B n=1 Tax=Marivita sp. TaxID=2003365 RepID=UPI003EF6FF19
GKDSHRHREAGAAQVLLSSGTRWALMSELRGAPEPTLEAHLAQLDPCDLVLVEGYKASDLAKIEAHRGATGQPLIASHDARIIAVASDSGVQAPVQVLHLDDTGAIADLIVAETGL